MVKRSALVGLLIGVLAVTVAFGAVDRECQYSDREWQRVFDEFGLEVADIVPAGVIPLEVTSPGQLRKLLSGSRNGTIELSVDAPDLQGMSLLTASQTLAMTETYVVLEKTDRHEWPCVFHLYARVWIVGSGSFWEITDCQDRVYFTGWEPFWSEIGGEWSDHHIFTNKQRIWIEGGGYIKGYFWTPLGMIHIYTYNYYLLIDYSL